MTSAGKPRGPSGSGSPSEPSDSEDREQVRRCLAGEIAAFEPLVEKHRERVWRLAHQILRDREEALDVAQEAFVRAFQSLSTFRGQAAFYTWLFRITVNLAMDRQRARRARMRALGTERVPEEDWERTAPDPSGGPDQEAVRAEQRQRIGRALDALPAGARTIIMLSDVQGLSYREIAQVLNCPIGTVMSRLHNARKRLRRLLGPLLVAVLAAAISFPPGALAGEGPFTVLFGVRVLQASGPGVPERAAPPGVQRGLVPQQGLMPPGQARVAEPELERILPRLRTLFRYTEYTTLERHRAEVSVGQHHVIPIAGARQLEVIPDSVKGGSVRMRVRLLRADQDEIRTTLVAAPGAPAVLGGPPHGDGALIIIIWAHPGP